MDKKGLKSSLSKVMELFKKDRMRNIIIIVGIIGIALIYLSSLFQNPKKAESTTEVDTATSTSDYEMKLEENLKRIVSAITGEADPEIMVTLESTEESVYAMDRKRSTQNTELNDTSENTIKESQKSENDEANYIIIKDASGAQQALKVTEIQPEIKGVVVVSDFGDQSLLKEKITDAVRTALNISSAKVCVQTMQRTAK